LPYLCPVKNFKSLIFERLRGLYPDSEIREFYFLILENVCRVNRQAILSDKGTQLSPNERLIAENFLKDLQKFRPVQYILGETEFFGMRLKVNENVLIPRPETEELVLIPSPVPHRQEGHSPLHFGEGLGVRLLDIATGSGCIAIALAKRFPSAKVYATDISSGAIEVARENATLNNVDVTFLQHDIFEDLPKEFPEQFDIIISNPPYITPDEKAQMSPNVLDYEPSDALFVPQDDPLLFYRRIADAGQKYLSAGGSLYFEINPRYADELSEMLAEKGYRDIVVSRDISGKNRFLKSSY